MARRWVYSIKDMNRLAVDRSIKPSKYSESALETTYVWAQPEVISSYVRDASEVSPAVHDFAISNDSIRRYPGTDIKENVKRDKALAESLKAQPISEVALDYGLKMSPIFYIGKRRDYKPGIVAIDVDGLEEHLKRNNRQLTFVEDTEIPGFRAYMMFDSTGASVEVPPEFYKAVPLSLFKEAIKRGRDPKACKDLIRREMHCLLEAHEQGNRKPVSQVDIPKINSLPMASAEPTLAVA